MLLSDNPFSSWSYSRGEDAVRNQEEVLLVESVAVRLGIKVIWVYSRGSAIYLKIVEYDRPASELEQRILRELGYQ